MSGKKALSESQSPGNVIFHIPLSIEMRKVDLPPMEIWRQLDSAPGNLQARIPVRLRTQGLIFDSKTSTLWRKCILSPKGYIVVYMKEEKLRGYAMDVTMANQIRVEALAFKYAKKKGYTGTDKDYVTVTLKWRNSSLKLFLAPERSSDWIDLLLSFQRPQRKAPKNCTSTPLQPVKNAEAHVSFAPTTVSHPKDDNVSDYDEKTIAPGADFWESACDWDDLKSITSETETILEETKPEEEGVKSEPKKEIKSEGDILSKEEIKSEGDILSKEEIKSEGDIASKEEIKSEPKEEKIVPAIKVGAETQSMGDFSNNLLLIPSVTVLGVSSKQMAQLRSFLAAMEAAKKEETEEGVEHQC